MATMADNTSAKIFMVSYSIMEMINDDKRGHHSYNKLPGIVELCDHSLWSRNYSFEDTVYNPDKTLCNQQLLIKC